MLVQATIQWSYDLASTRASRPCCAASRCSPAGSPSTPPAASVGRRSAGRRYPRPAHRSRGQVARRARTARHGQPLPAAGDDPARRRRAPPAIRGGRPSPSSPTWSGSSSSPSAPPTSAPEIPHQAVSLDQLEADHENLRVALLSARQRAVGEDLRLAGRSPCSGWPWADRRGPGLARRGPRRPARRRIDELAQALCVAAPRRPASAGELPSGPGATPARPRPSPGSDAPAGRPTRSEPRHRGRQRRRTGEAAELHTEAIALEPRDDRRADNRRFALDNLGNVLAPQVEVAEARSRHEQSLALRRELGGHTWGPTWAAVPPRDAHHRRGGRTPPPCGLLEGAGDVAGAPRRPGHPPALLARPGEAFHRRRVPRPGGRCAGHRGPRHRPPARGAGGGLPGPGRPGRCGPGHRPHPRCGHVPVRGGGHRHRAGPGDARGPDPEPGRAGGRPGQRPGRGRGPPRPRWSSSTSSATAGPPSRRSRRSPSSPPASISRSDRPASWPRPRRPGSASACPCPPSTASASMRPSTWSVAGTTRRRGRPGRRVRSCRGTRPCRWPPRP